MRDGFLGSLEAANLSFALFAARLLQRTTSGGLQLMARRRNLDYSAHRGLGFRLRPRIQIGVRALIQIGL